MKVLVLCCFLAMAAGAMAAPVTVSLRHTLTSRENSPLHAFRRGPEELSIELKGIRSPQQAPVSPQSYPMGGNILPVGIYWMEIDLGTPPQKLLVAVDSGSSDTLVPQKGCVGCHTQNTGVFDPSNSSTVSPVSCHNSTHCNFHCVSNQCSFTNSYETCNLTDPNQPCTVKGPLWNDYFQFGGSSVLRQQCVFGTIDEQSANFQQFYVIDGLCGFAFDAGSSWGGVSPFQELVNAGEIDDVLSMCLQPLSGGVITLGGTDSTYFTGNFAYTPLERTFGEYILYVIKMTDIEVNGKSIGVASSKYGDNSFGGCVVDSGTNTLLLSNPIYEGLQKTLVNQLCPGFAVPGICENGNNLFTGNCYQYDATQLQQFPTIDLNINGIKLSIDGEQYLITNTTSSDAFYCFGIKNTGPLGNLIIGDVVMQNYYVQFDRANKRLGWASAVKSKCSGSVQP